MMGNVEPTTAAMAEYQKYVLKTRLEWDTRTSLDWLENKHLVFRLFKPFSDSLWLLFEKLKMPWTFYFDGKTYVRGPQKNQPLSYLFKSPEIISDLIYRPCVPELHMPAQPNEQQKHNATFM